MNGLTKALAAEFTGTFALIFLGAGAATALGGGQLPAIALAHGLTIMVFASAFGDISGCHINPAVTVGLAAAGKFPGRHIAPYIVAQVVGAVAAGYCLLLVFGGPVNHLGATLVDTQRITYGGAFALEAIGTFFLVNTVLHAAVRGAAGQLAPFAIGMTVTVCILMFGALTGGSVNPARTIGPAVAAGVYDGITVYLVAQLVGGTLAGLLYRVFWVTRAEPGQLKTGAVLAE
ncbi:MAG TPA: aquaporin [Acetobacteraceae bacterium]|jgi:MIP family channel proteins|nr:aquaporin [Acetobacteraceae bacterium]